MNGIRKLPIDVQSFEKLRTGGYLYVDKTDLVYKLAAEGSQYFLSRPRRFGKSLLTRTLQAYFEGQKDLFSRPTLKVRRISSKALPSKNWKRSGRSIRYSIWISPVLTSVVRERLSWR